MSDFIQVTTAIGDGKQADRLATILVERAIVGCVQIIGPVQSVYRWRGKVERAEEWLLLIKTTMSQYAAVDSAIREFQSYECPEVIATAIVAGSKDYLDWLRAATAPIG